MGDCPNWYRLIKAAQYLQVPPWELAERSLAWVYQAEAAQGAEAHAREMHEKRHRTP